MPDDPIWLASLRDLLCRIYREWGGDCADLPATAPAQIAAVEDEYVKNGAPGFETSKERDDFLDALTALEGHLNLAANCLSDSDDATLRTLITNLRNDIIPPV